MSKLYKLKQDLGMVGAELEKVTAELMEKAPDPNVAIEDINELEQKKAHLQKRFNLIQTEHDAEKKRDEEKFEPSNIIKATSDEARVVSAKAEFIRATLTGKEMSAEAREILATNTEPPLKALPSDGTTTGHHLLPSNMDKELIHEPFVKNQLRGRVGMTAIKGLEMPKVDFTLDDDAFIADDVSAKEIELTGSQVVFNRNKFKVKVRISDTVVHGSDANLVSYVENNLQAGLAAKERKEAFATGDSLDLNSFYEDDGETPAVYLITEVEGEDMYSAITNGLADLHEDFRENAQVCMRFADYVTMLKDLSNSSMPLYGKPPEEIIGAPVFFSDAAHIVVSDNKVGVPIIGDFRNYHINYDPETVYDTDKDVDKGNYIWVLTAWFDMKFKLRSAFRLATVSG